MHRYCCSLQRSWIWMAGISAAASSKATFTTWTDFISSNSRTQSSDDVAVSSEKRTQTVAWSAWSHGVPVCHQLMAASWMVVVDKSVQLPTSADSVTLLAFAAERRPCSSRLISPARLPCRGVWRPNDGVGGRTDRRTPYHYIDPTPPNMPAVPLTLMQLLLVVEWFPHRTVIKC